MPGGTIQAAGAAAPSPAAAALIDAFEAAIPAASARTADAMFAEIPAYARITDPAFKDDVTAYVAQNLEAMVRSMRRGRPVTREDLLFVRAAATQRLRRGVPLADYLHAYRIGHGIAWETIMAAAVDDESRIAALAVVGSLLEYVNVTSAHVAEVYVEVEQLLLAEGERVRRDLLDDLLSGRRPPAGPRQLALRAAGLADGGAFVVVAAQPAMPVADEHALRAAATALGRAGRSSPVPLAVLRGDEVVAVVPVDEEHPRDHAAAVRAIHPKLAEQDLPLTVGVSTVVDAPEQLPAAYREAIHARTLAGEGGVLCLSELDAFEYLTLAGDETAGRLIPAEVARFVAEDLADGGVLTTTLLEYAAADLNAKAAAERLYIHVNTAHYRLTRIAERTGRDLRRLSDIIELLIAVRLASGRGAGRPPA